MLTFLGGCVRPEAALTPTAVPTAAPTAAPTAVPTAPTLAPTLAPLIDITLPDLPPPTSAVADLPLPPVWLVVGERAILGTPGGFTYTGDLGSGQISSVTTDGGAPQMFPNLAMVNLPVNSQAFVVIGEPGKYDVADVRGTLGAWASVEAREPFFNELLAPLFDQPSPTVQVYELPPVAADGERLLSIGLSFTGTLHENDYALYYWRLVP